jgi:glycosyltransferase involved in cell wall biosynthesis
MRVWLITVGEPLPTDNGGGDRVLRTGILADLLARRGNEVTYWSSTFDHVRKRQRFQGDREIKVRENYRLRLLHASRYPKNVSIRRIMNHRGVAKKFQQQSTGAPRPDVILCSLPTLELCAVATEFGRKFNVPVVLDIRDLWPDVLTELAPAKLRWLARTVLHPMLRQAKTACSQATAITGVTADFIDWGLRQANRGAGKFDVSFPMGYAVKALTPAARSEAESFWNAFGLSRSTPEFVACWFGTVGRYFELDIVIDAANRLSKSGRRVRFVLCGAGPALEKYKRLARSCSNVIFPGWVNAAQISVLMQMSSIGLAPYINNQNFRLNIPNKPIEYLSAGLPIISSLQGTLAQLLRNHDCGITYLNRRADELADAIAGLYDQPERLRTMAAKAQLLYQSRFVADHVYGEMQHYLNSIATFGAESLLHARDKFAA